MHCSRAVFREIKIMFDKISARLQFQIIELAASANTVLLVRRTQAFTIRWTTSSVASTAAAPRWKTSLWLAYSATGTRALTSHRSIPKQVVSPPTVGPIDIWDLRDKQVY
jgi:hypothetical protein